MSIAAGAKIQESAGLCAACQHVRLVRTDRGAVFYQCKRSATDPRFPKYPTLPVLSCAGYEPTPLEADENKKNGDSRGMIWVWLL